jgi:AcrR family transcriptional regulator
VERARKQEETRRRIVEAVMDLHRTVGPARTTVCEVAERAGVGRMTVYNHFRTDRDLIGACSQRWAEENPFPDPAPWLEIDDPDRRADLALRSLFAWYRSGRDMLEKVLRDGEIVPALAGILSEGWYPYLEGVVDVLMVGRGESTIVRASLRLLVDFGTWKLLASSGLDDDTAAGLAVSMASIAPHR